MSETPWEIAPAAIPASIERGELTPMISPAEAGGAQSKRERSADQSDSDNRNFLHSGALRKYGR